MRAVRKKARTGGVLAYNITFRKHAVLISLANERKNHEWQYVKSVYEIAVIVCFYA